MLLAGKPENFTGDGDNKIGVKGVILSKTHRLYSFILFLKCNNNNNNNNAIYSVLKVASKKTTNRCLSKNYLELSAIECSSFILSINLSIGQLWFSRWEIKADFFRSSVQQVFVGL